MKKLLLVLAIGSLAAFVACNDGGGAEGTKTDSAATAPADSAAMAPAPADSAAAAAPAPAVDSTKKDTTTAKKKK